jgi:hypothetical protein
MTPRTIEETFEYRITNILKRLFVAWGYEPTSPENLFDFLKANQDEFAGLVIEDMIKWSGEQFWFDEIKK